MNSLIKNDVEMKVVANVPEALTLLTTLKTNIRDKLSAQITVATHALDQLEIHGRVHPSAPFSTLYSASGSFTTLTGRLLLSSGDLTTQAVGTGYFDLDVSGLYEITIYAASVHANGSLVTLFSSLR